MLSYPRVLLLSSDEAETRKLEKVFREHATLKRAKNLAELQSNLEGNAHDAIFCALSFQQGTWSIMTEG